MDEVKKKKINRYYCGCIIYRFEGSNIIQRRIVSYKESKDRFIVRDQENNKEESISSDEIIDNWILLNPDAVITISICKLQRGRDVLVCLHNTEHLDPIPDVVCRQSIADMYSDTAYKISPEYKMTGKEILFVGASFTQQTCPAEVDFRLLVACESVESSTKCAYYLTDDLEDILSYIKNKSKYNKELASIRMAGIETANRAGIPVDGYQTSLKDLLVSTKFMDDVHRVFNIRHLEFDLGPIDAIINPDDPRFMAFMLRVVEKQISGMYVSKYSKEVDLKKIQREYVLAIPFDEKNNKQRSAKDLYIVGYDSVD